jgi:hypothetical protein
MREAEKMGSGDGLVIYWLSRGNHCCHTASVVLLPVLSLHLYVFVPLVLFVNSMAVNRVSNLCYQ